MVKSKKIISTVLSAGILLSSLAVINTQKVSAATSYILNAKIPYHDFYAAYGTDTLKGVTTDGYIDSVTSATLSKAKMNQEGGLCSGTYYSEAPDGSTVYIDGVVFPVVVSEEAYKALIKDAGYSEADFNEIDADSYPANYLDVKVTDGKAVYSVPDIASTKISGVKAVLNTNTRYGDYQISLSGGSIDENIAQGKAVVYGVIINTAENNKYPMYTLENIWRNTEIAWSAGFVTETHGCSLRPDIYKSIMGETINGITYITDKGIYDIAIEDMYIPKKTSSSVTADNVTAKNITEVTTKLSNMPASFQPEVSITGFEAVAEQVSSGNGTDGTVNYIYSVKADKIVPDTYTITVKDLSKEYADIVASVDVRGANVTFDGTKLIMEQPAAGDSIANFLDKISGIEVTTPTGETVTYLPKLGRGSAVIANIFDENGNLDLSAKYESIKVSGGHGNQTTEIIDAGDVFAAEGTYKVSVITSVYDIVTFNLQVNKQAAVDNINIETTVNKPAKVIIKSVKNSGKKTITVKWNKTENADGYETRYVTGGDIKKANVTGTATSIKIKNLEKGKTYKVSVRAYKTIDGKRYNGSWSKVLKVKVKK